MWKNTIDCASGICCFNQRSLVLTHTYAGVDALRKRLKDLGAPAPTYEVETIAGWSLRLALSFPNSSGIRTRRPEKQQWDVVYAAAASLLSIRAIKMVVEASYDSVFVDEYQDCSPLQHKIILKLAEILPTRILGDPMQGILIFKGSRIVDWQNDVEPNFTKLFRLTKPYRWAKKSPALGEWLLLVRHQLEASRPIDLRSAPSEYVRFVQLPSKPKQQAAIQREQFKLAKCKEKETLLAIHSWEHQCHKIARFTGGKFRSTETIECPAFFKAAKAFDNATDGSALAREVFKFACQCLTKIKTDLGKTAERVFDGYGLQKNHTYKYQKQLDALVKIVESGSLSSVREALIVLSKMPGAKKARYELFLEMLNTLREYETGQYDRLEEAAVRTRDRTRRMGRAPGCYVVSRTLLVKGLEFDHVIVLNADDLDKKNLYVALTRASRSLTVLSTSPILDPRW
jgi:superfamily I DNA/RNA helicase